MPWERREHDIRGSSHDRRRRKRWLLETFGDGTTAPCAHCGEAVTYSTIYVDRIVPGKQGGRYTRDNIRPSCADCSYQQANEYAVGRDTPATTFDSPV